MRRIKCWAIVFKVTCKLEVMSMLEQGERRKFVRMETECKMSYRFPQAEQSHESVCHNLSGAGLMFTANHDMDPGQALEIKISPANEVTPPLEAFVEVLRCSDLGAGQYQVAAQIKAIKS